MEQIGNRIEALRNKHLMTKEALAEKLNISVDEINKYESLEVEPDLLMVQRFAYALKEPLEFFFVDSEAMRNPAFNPGLTFILFTFINKLGKPFVNVLFSIEPNSVTSTLRYEFIDKEMKKFKFSLNEEQTTEFIAGIDKCQVINWREMNYGASLSNICTYFSDKLYVRPETFRYRIFMESFRKVSSYFLSDKEMNILNEIDINEPMYYHNELEYEVTKKTIETLDKTKEYIDSKISLADEIFWDMY